jgi:hypothetical protein
MRCAVGLLALLLAACVTYREDLNRGQRLYDESQYERALAIFRVLEADQDSLAPPDRARYFYLRGMTDYRLGFRRDARHWLALAKASEHEHPGGLAPEWRDRIEKYLGELNREVYGLGPEPGDEAEARAQ